MKKIITIVLLGTLFSLNFAFATSTVMPCEGNALKTCSNKDLLDVGFGENLPKENQISTLSELISRIQIQLAILNPKKTSNPTCQKITQTLWEGKTDAGTNGQITLLINFLNKIINTIPCQAPAGSSCPAIAINLVNSGIYNSAVTQQVKKLQSYWGVYQTGNVGPKTLAKINSMICNSVNSNVTPGIRDGVGNTN